MINNLHRAFKQNKQVWYYHESIIICVWNLQKITVYVMRYVMCGLFYWIYLQKQIYGGRATFFCDSKIKSGEYEQYDIYHQYLYKLFDLCICL